MDNDDDMIMLVVGGGADSDGIVEEIPDTDQIKIKTEVFDPYDECMIEEVLETVEKYGESIDVDIGQIIKKEPEEDTAIEYVDETMLSDDEEYVPNFEYEEYEELDESIQKVKRKFKFKKGCEKKEVQRNFMLKPSECRSYVEELREEHPELREDEELLIETLAVIMRNIRTPDLPTKYFTTKANTYECDKCDHVTISLPAAGRHYQEKHGKRYLICFSCGVDFRSKTNLYKHEKRCPGDDRVIVLKARALFVGRKGRSRPFIPKVFKAKKKTSVASKARFSCERCPATFHSKPALMSHHYLHEGRRPFQCTQCSAAYTSASALTRHAAKHTDIQFICDHCKRSFKVKAALVVHMNTHQPEKRFGCDLCDKRYAQKMALMLHINRCHKNLPPPFACQICPKRFPRMSLLSNHMLKMHGMKMITRKMFFNHLPTMSDEQTLQQARLVFKGEEQVTPKLPLPVTEQNQQETETIEFEYTEIEIEEHNGTISNDNYQTEIHIPQGNEDFQLSEALLHYIEKLQKEGTSGSVKVVYIKDDEVIEIDENSAEGIALQEGEVLV